MEKQTAVQYLRSEIKDKDNGEMPKWVYKFIEDSILKEKQQIKDAFMKGENTIIMDAEEYYNETYLK